MRKISLWVIAVTMVLVASIGALGQAQTETQTKQPAQKQNAAGETQDGRRRQRRPNMDANQDGQISREEWKRPAEVFARIDTNNDGSLSREELTAGRQLRRKGDRSGSGRKGVGRIDQNNDGQISREEWKRPAEAFARIDTNNDGSLTQEELRAARGSKRDGTRKGFGRKGFGGLDLNNDGQITREEWKRQPEVFDRLDANKDGVVKDDELKGHRKGRRPGK